VISRLVAPFAALLLALGLWAAPAEAVSNLCPDVGGTAYLVDTPAEALDIQTGYNNPACNLVISVDVDPTVTTWAAAAKTFTLSAKVINTLAFSKVNVRTDGDIQVLAGSIAARAEVNLLCLSLGCQITSTPGSFIVASQTLSPFKIPGDPSSGFEGTGTLNVVAGGIVDLQGEALWGGSRFKILAQSYKVRVKSAPVNTCPCPESRGAGGGGAQEVRFTATNGNGDIEDTEFTFLNHVTFDVSGGALLADNTKILSANDIQALADKGIRMRKAQWISLAGFVKVQARDLPCAVPGLPAALVDLCIAAQQSDIFGRQNIIALTKNNAGRIDICGSIQDRELGGLPSLNGKASFPYPLTVILDVIQCALEGLPAAILNP
jgi:hypothetical protein